MNKKYYGYILAAAIIAGAAYCLTHFRGSSDAQVVPVTSERPGQNGQKIAHFADASVGLQFDYRTSPSGYVVLSQDGNEISSEDAPIKAFTLFLKTDYEELQRNAGIPRDGPQSINIQVFNPGPNITPNEWAVQHPARSNFQTGTPITWQQIDGNAAARYSWDGLYQGQTVVIARKGWVYMVTLSYADSSMLKDFNELLTTLKLQR